MIGLSPTSICNLALDAVPTRRISSLSEDSYAAELCSTQFPQAFSEMLESWTWGWARLRVDLAGTTNSRPTEWAYAFALPTDLALPIRILGNLASQPRNATSWDEALQPMAYEIAGQTLYTDVGPVATLEHLNYGIAPAFSTAMFVRATAMQIASKLVMPITKNAAREKDLLQQAEVFTQRARAVDANRQPQTYGDFIPEALAYRWGGVAPPIFSDAPVPGVTTDNPNPGGGSDATYSYPDWSADFLAGLNFTVPGAH